MKPKEVVCMMALQFAWPVSVNFEHFFFFFYQTTYYTRTNKIKISQMIIISFSKWLPPRFVNKRKPFQYDLLALFSIKQKKMSSRNWSSVHDLRNLMKTEWIFLQNRTCCLIHCLKSTSTNSFQIKKYPIFGWILFFVIFKEVLKSLLHFSPVWHSTVCQANDFLLNQILKYLLFAFSLLRWLHLYAKIFETFLSCFHLAFFKYKEAGWSVQSIFLSNIQTISNE